MNVMRENEIFVLPKSIEAKVIGEHKSLVLETGTVVTVVLVYGDPNTPTAYEVEAFLPVDNVYALATIEATDIS